MPKRVLLVGHCGPDNSYLRMALRSAYAGAEVLAADDDTELADALQAGVDLVLLNRDLGYGFVDSEGVVMIQLLRKKFPGVKVMLVSNYAEAQSAAIAAGALPGFGKREIGSKRVTELLRDALG